MEQRTGQEPSYLRTALTPRLLLLLVLLLGAAAVSGRLGAWQLDRAELRGEAAAERAQQEALGAAPVPLADVMTPQTAFPGAAAGHRVVVRGEYEGDELLVAGRAVGGRTGLLVLSPLRVELPDGAAPVLAVVRGWVPDAAAAAALDPAPAGTVEVTGYLQPGEAGGSGDLPAGQVDAISPAELVNRWGGPTYSAYVVLAGSVPAQDPDLTPPEPPELQQGGLNVQNLAYALQWWIFGGFAVLLWVRLVRDDTRAAREERAEREGPDSAGLTPVTAVADADAVP